MTPSGIPAQFTHRVDVHDKKQLELKLEYEPRAEDPRSRYLIEMYLFVPASLNVDADTYPRSDFYADIHNYVRLKTPVLEVGQMLALEQSPLVKLERVLERDGELDEPALVYQAKLLSCVYRAALRRMVRAVNEHCRLASAGRAPDGRAFDAELRAFSFDAEKVLTRFRVWNRKLIGAYPDLEERTRASLRLVDEYMSLAVEQFFRKAVADMDELPRIGVYTELRKELMADVIREEDYRKEHRLRSVLSPSGDNEEYMHRIGFLKKFCMNILFLTIRRRAPHKGLEEALFAIAAGLAMAFATAVAFLAQRRFAQLSLNFFLILVVGYMMKDRIKEGLRRIFFSVAAKHLYDRTTMILDPTSGRAVGRCREKLDYAAAAPRDIADLRQEDDFNIVSQGELAETVLRYQKEIILSAEALPRINEAASGVTDIVRLNVGHFCRDMDDPEFAIEYVDLEDLSVGRVRGAKSYNVDLSLRFTVGEGPDRSVSTQQYRVILDRNGIKRLQRAERPQPASAAARSVA